MADEKRDMARTMGPVLGGVVVTADLDVLVAAYTDHLQMHVTEQGSVPAALLAGWDMPALKNCRYAMLESATGRKWLRIIEQVGAPLAEPISSFGWMSLEVLVEDVFALAKKLEDSPFRFIGPPRELDVSGGISACQVVGPAGEVLYLTTVLKPSPPAELPIAQAEVDHLFIPVLAVPDRQKAIDFYSDLANSKADKFDMRVTVVNRALGKPIERKLPISTIQLNDKSLIEIDQIEEFASRQVLPSGLVGGVAVVSFVVESLDRVRDQAIAGTYMLDDAFYQGREAMLMRSPTGELVEFVAAS